MKFTMPLWRDISISDYKVPLPIPVNKNLWNYMCDILLYTIIYMYIGCAAT